MSIELPSPEGIRIYNGIRENKETEEQTEEGENNG